MGYKQGSERKQVRLLPPAIEDYVPKNSEVRVIDAFADILNDVKFQYTDFSGRGNQPYNPKDMLKLYIFGYLKGIRLSRKLERECRENIALIWLINELKPDDKTICNFRKNNKETLYKIFKEFTVICKKAKLFSTVIVDNMKTKEAREKLIKRKGMIELIYGVIKRCLGFEYVLTRGIENIKAEFSLTALAYNFKRALNILGVDNFMKLLST